MYRFYLSVVHGCHELLYLVCPLLRLHGEAGPTEEARGWVSSYHLLHGRAQPGRGAWQGHTHQPHQQPT